MTAGVIMLGAYGKLDMYISYNPQITFFKIVYKRHTYFSQEAINQYFTTTPNFDTQTSCILFNNADLVSDIYLNITLPAIPKSLANSNYYYKWIDYVGLNLIKKIDVVIGNKVIQRLEADFLFTNFITKGFTNKTSKKGTHKRGIDILTGNTTDLTTYTTQKNSYQLSIPLPFWFCQSTGTSLPLNSLNLSEVQINLELNKLGKLLSVGATHSITVRETVCLFTPQEYIYQGATNSIGIFLYYDSVSKTIYFNQLQGSFQKSTTSIEKELVNSYENNYLIRNSKYYYHQPTVDVQDENTKLNISANISNAYLLVNYIFLENTERLKYYRLSHQYLIEQQQYYYNTKIVSPNNRILLNFVNPLIELIFIVRLNNHLEKNIIYCFKENADNSGTELVKSCQVTFNGADIMSSRTVDFTQLIEMYKCHKNCTINRGINIYSFSLSPEEVQPSGSCNFSRIEKSYLEFTVSSLVSYSNKASIKVIGRSYNIIQLVNGTVELLFDNNQ